jgi:hypothetical protein
VRWCSPGYELPSFAQAIFLADEQGERGFSVMVFQTEDQAVGMAERLGSGQVPTPPGVAFERQDVWNVVATG